LAHSALQERVFAASSTSSTGVRGGGGAGWRRRLPARARAEALLAGTAGWVLGIKVQGGFAVIESAEAPCLALLPRRLAANLR